MAIKLTSDQICNAVYVEGWNICLWGMPKLTIVCGNCKGQFKTRDYVPFNRGKSDKNTVSCCPYCGKWNKLGLILE